MQLASTSSLQDGMGMSYSPAFRAQFTSISHEVNDMDATIEMIDTSEMTEVVIALLDVFFC